MDDRAVPAMPCADAWDVLDRFVQDLQQCTRPTGQFRLLLEAVRDGLGADAVFLYPAPPGESPESVGSFAVRSLWAHGLVDAVLGANSGASGSVLWSGQPALSRAEAPQPASVAMVQVSRSKGAWVVAVSLDPARPFRGGDLRLMVLSRRLLGYHFQQLSNAEDVKDTLFGLVYCLTATIDAKDPHTRGHSERVARMAVRLAREMGLPGPFASDLYLAGLLHDVGKIGVRDGVLQKPGELTEEEVRHVQEHPVIGDRIVANVKKLAGARPGVRHHHERYDGTGYPDRLAGDSIPLMARILAVADACDAMMSPRPYRRALPPREIERLMADGAGSQWDPGVVRHFLSCKQELYAIRQGGSGESVAVAVEQAVEAGRKSLSEFPAGAGAAR